MKQIARVSDAIQIVSQNELEILILLAMLLHNYN